MLTLIESIQPTAQAHLISPNDAGIDGQQAACNPPPGWIADKVNLLTSVALGPETDASEQERPLVRVRRVRVAARELAVVQEHGALSLEILPEE